MKCFLARCLVLLGLVPVSHQVLLAAEPRPAVGVALSGGGARGAAHIGVLRVLEELRVPIDYIAGTSMGSIIGGLYASGMTPDEIEASMLAIDWDDVFVDEPPRKDRSFRSKRDDDLYLINAKPGFNDGEINLPTGFVQGQKFDLILRELTLPVSHVEDFDQLAIPYRAVATAIGTGDEVVLSSGDLATAMRASMSVPGAFAATEIDGQLLVDGGIANNLPIDQVRAMGADIVIAVNISTPMRPPEEVSNVLSITGQLVSILTNRNTAAQLATLTERDILIQPDLGNITSGDFNRAADAIPRGKAAAEAARELLRHLSLSDDDYRQHVAARVKPDTARPVIQFVHVDNQSHIDDRLILERLHVPLGEPLDTGKLDADIEQVYGLDLFERVNYEVVEEDGISGLVVHARERSWGPNYLQFGAALSGDIKGSNHYNLGVMYLRTAINSLGGDLRTGFQLGEEPLLFVELHQPLIYNARFFLEPEARVKRQNINIFTDGDKVGEYRVATAGGSLAVGREFGTWGEFRLGVSRSTGEAKVLVGDPRLPSFDFEDGDVYARLTADELDNVNFPRSGVYARLEGRWNRGELGADDNYDQATFNFLGAYPWRRNTLLIGGELGSTFNGTAGIQDRYRIGGFTRLSGLQTDELTGQQFGIVKVVYYRRFGEIKLLPIYLGGSLEAGNAWEETDEVDWDDLITSGAVFLGMDSPIGPVYVGGGVAEGGRSSMFMSLGRKF